MSFMDECNDVKSVYINRMLLQQSVSSNICETAVVMLNKTKLHNVRLDHFPSIRHNTV